MTLVLFGIFLHFMGGKTVVPDEQFSVLVTKGEIMPRPSLAKDNGKRLILLSQRNVERAKSVIGEDRRGAGYTRLITLQPTHGAWSTSDVHTVRGTALSTSTYHRLIRPSEKTYVNASLSLLTINNLDVKTQTLSTTGWLTVEWSDSRLTWSTHPDVTHFYALDTEVWKPEFFIDNSLSDVSILEDSNVMFKVGRDGVVEWKLPRIFTTFCNVDVTYYPFDTQNCVVEITSWAYSIDELEMRASRETVNLEDMKPHGEWTILSSSVTKKELQETKENGVTEKFSQLDFNIKMQRKSSYYISSVLLPVLLTSYLNIFVFLLPVDSGEKVGFILTVLLATAVLLTLVSDSIPSTSITTSVLSVYLAVTLCLGVVCCLLTVMVIRVHFKDPDIPVSAGWKSLHDKILVPFSCSGGCKKGKNNNVKPTSAPQEVVVVNYEDGKHEAESTSSDDSSDGIKWVDVSAALDQFFMIVMSIVTTLSSVTFMVALAAGGKANET